MPRLPYLTLLDRFILMSTLLVFLSLVEVLITSTLAARGRIDAARTLDRHARWIFPSVFTAVAAALYVR